MAQASATGDEGFSLALDSLGSLHWLGIGTAAASGAVHLYLGVQPFVGPSKIPTGLGAAFLFAGVVFLIGIAAVVVDYRRRAFYALGVPFTLGQIVLWYVFNMSRINAGNVGPIDIVDKVAQVLLVAVLVVLYRREG